MKLTFLQSSSPGNYKKWRFGSRYYLSLLIILSMMIKTELRAQDRGPHEIQISIFNEAITIPTYSPIWKTDLQKHVGFSVGLNWYYKRSGKNYFFWNASVQTFDHAFMYTGLELCGAWNYRREFSRYFNVGLETGLGYFHRFMHSKEYKVEDGHYAQTRKVGIPSLLFTLGAQMNWYPKNFFKSGSIFLKYQLQGFYHFAGTVPVLPFTLTHIGVTYPFHKIFTRDNREQ